MSNEAARELEVRTRWTLTRLAETINEGRAAGWLAGSPISITCTSASVLSASADAAVDTPMQLLASRLRLSDAELDALWLLACIELAPMVACAAQQLFVMNTNTITVQVLERLLAVGDEGFTSKSITRLARYGLAETTSDPHAPLFRRSIRVSDRVL